MLSRRQFVFNIVATLTGASALDCRVGASELIVFQGEDVFNRIVAKSIAGGWNKLPIGDLIGKVATELEGTPYKANTLELSPDKESCSVNLTALDCVTFFETSLAIARILKKGKHTRADLLSEVGFTRYRGGKPGDYTTRLHYMIDWLADNERKHVVEPLSQLPGEAPFMQKVGMMSEHPEASTQLSAHPSLIAKIKDQENAINKRSMKFVPTEKIAAAEPFLKTGDIVAICTNQPGLDIAHTGLIFCIDGVPHFMDASSRKSKMMVNIEPESLTQALSRSKNATGAMFARPLEPRI